MPVYTVIGYERTVKMMRVEAGDEAEAVAKAKAGDYTDCDTEPGPSIDKAKWHVAYGVYTDSNRAYRP